MVAFLNAGRVFKVTATADDAPATQNMPFTVDTTGIIKARDQEDQIRIFGGDRAGRDFPMGVSRTVPATPNIAFTTAPSFGISIPSTSGVQTHKIYRSVAGVAKELGTSVFVQNQSYWFFALTERILGAVYYVEPVVGGQGVGVFSNVIQDLTGTVVVSPDNAILSYGQTGDTIDLPVIIGGGASSYVQEDGFGIITRGAVKLSIEEPPQYIAGAGGSTYVQEDGFGVITRGTVKSTIEEPAQDSAGGGGSV